MSWTVVRGSLKTAKEMVGWRGIEEVYCPKITVMMRMSHRRGSGPRQLQAFPGYLFCRIGPGQRDERVRIVMIGREQMMVSEDDVMLVRESESMNFGYQTVSDRPVTQPVFTPGTLVSVSQSSQWLGGCVGIVREQRGDSVTLDIYGLKFIAKVSAFLLTPIGL